MIVSAARRRYALALAVVALGSALGAGPAGAAAGGGSGTVKIDTVIPQNPNSPHQECGLSVKFFDFDPAGPTTATVTFTQQGGANAGTIIPTSPASGPATSFGFTAGSGGGAVPDGYQAYFFDTSNLTPAPNGTYLVDVDTVVSNGVTSKQKVIRVSSCRPDLKIVKTLLPAGSSSVALGGPVSYLLTVTNIGSVGVPTYTVADALPGYLTWATTTSNTSGLVCDPAGAANVSCTYNNVAQPLVPGASASVTVTSTLDPLYAGTSISNTATVSPTDGTPSNNTSTLVTAVAQPVDVGLSKTATPAAVNPGDSITYTLDVVNSGLTPVTSFDITDALATGLTFVSATSNSIPAGLTCNAAAPVTCTFNGTLAPNGHVTATVVAQVASTYTAQTIENDASVAMVGDAVSGNNDASVVTAVNQSVLLDVVKAKSGPAGAITPGTAFDYTLSVSNSGNLAATAFTVTDALPAGVTTTALPSGTNYTCTGVAVGATAVSCTWAGTLTKAGPAALLTIPVVLDAAFTGTTISNTGAVDGFPSNTVRTAVTQPVDVCTNIAGLQTLVPTGYSVTGTICTAPVIVITPAPVIVVIPTPVVVPVVDPVPVVEDPPAAPAPAPVVDDLGISKTPSSESVAPGGRLSWIVTVTKVAGTPASGFSVTDALPSGLTLLTVGGADWACPVAAGLITCTYTGSPLAVSETTSFAVDTIVDASYAGSSVSNTAVVDPADADASNNSSTATTAVVAPFTGGGGGAVVTPPAQGGGVALPFTGSQADRALTAGVALLLSGLFLALAGRRRRSV